MTLELVIENLSKTYPNGVTALRDVNLRIPTGMFGLLGPNGAGKSTLMRTIATLQEPDRGSVRLGDIDVLTQKEALRQVLGYLPQEFGVYPRVSAEAMLDHLAVLKGITEKRRRAEIVASLLQKTNLYEARKRNLGTYSGGMKQRFGIAQALLGEPKLVIVDEPTAGLDPEERLRFHNLLSEIGENIVVILSTHIVEDVRELCPQMAIIAGGKILLSGRPDEAIGALSGKVWKKTVERAEIEAFSKAFTVLSTRLSGGKRVVHVFSEERPDEGFSSVPVDLEDVYFSTLRGQTSASPVVSGEAAHVS